MKFLLVGINMLILLISCTQSNSTDEVEINIKKVNLEQINEFAIVIHGGAGTIKKSNMTDAREAEYRNKLEEAVRVGYDILYAGGSSLDAVEKAINVMENSPLFNAGKGAVFTNAGTNEMDASVMEGNKLDAGAVTGIKTVKNPISAAIKVMNESNHVFLSGSGADEFAASVGLELVSPEYFFTERRMKSLIRVKEEERDTEIHQLDKATSYYDEDIRDSKFGTVGCVALDKSGNIVAGTSTGGMTNKRWNRIGDSPIIGAGTYANNKTCGVSATGWGEYFIRGTVAHDISAMMEYKGSSLKEATGVVIQEKLTELGGTGGVVALDHLGNMSFEFNTAGMYRASMNDKGELTIEIFESQQ